MNEEPLIICVGRQLGSGGREIGKLLAKRFGCQFYDKEILNIAAKESGLSERVFEENDEHKHFLKNFLHLRPSMLSSQNGYSEASMQDRLFQFQSDAIRKAADSGPCVFVGRCADYILRDKQRLVSIFISADEADRVKHVAERKQLDENAARKLIQSKERKRAAFYNFYSGKRWGDAASYDFCINSSRLGIAKTEELIAQYIKEQMNETHRDSE